MRGELPVTFVRPSIVESALAEPRPGWIRGFRMAEPVIISYARGLLRQFPGRSRGHRRRHPRRPRRRRPHRRGSAEVPTRPDRRSTRSPRASGTRCATDSWSTSPSGGSPSDPSTTTAASRSSCRSGPSPAAARSKVSSAVPREPSAPPSGSSTCCRSAASGRRPAPGSRSDECTQSGPSATSSSTAPTPRPRRAFGSTARLRSSRASTPADQHARSASTPRSSTGATTSRMSTCPRSSSTPASAPPRGKRTMASREERSLKAILSDRAPLCGVRPREDPHQLERRRDLCVARDPPPRPHRAGPGRRRPPRGGAEAAPARPPRPERLPARLLPTLRGRPRRSAPSRRLGAVQRSSRSASLPGGDRPGAQPSGARPQDAAHHRRARLRRRAARPLFDEIVCAEHGRA